MGSETVVFYDASPVCVDHFWTFLIWSDAVLPVILIGKAAARPSEDRDPKIFQCPSNVIPEAVSIGYRRIFSDPYSAVNAPAQMLGEMSINVLVDDTGRNISVDE